jgi:DHA2 family multidrug resistance protein-like MFS transporter
LAWRVLPKDTQISGVFDLPGAVLSVIAIGFVLAGVEGIAHGINPVLTIAAFVLAAVVGASLLHRERAVAAPIFPVDLLRVRVFRLCVLTAVLSFMAQMLAYTALPFMLERSHGMSQVQTGVSLMAWPAALALTAPVAGWLSDRYPPMRIGAIGLLLYGVGLVLLITMPAAVGIPGVALRLVCCGIGLGLFQSPNMRLAISATPLRRSGAAGGMTSASRLFGQTIGSALVALAYRLSDAQGGQYALWGGIAATLIAAAISVSRARERLPTDRRSLPLHEPGLVE